jgi:para-aminobenzoate synthetase component 1
LNAAEFPQGPPRVEPLPYVEDVAPLFAPLAERPWAMWLDSGRPGSAAGRYDILVADPLAWLVSDGTSTRIRHRDGGETFSAADPLVLLREALGDRRPSHPELPFSGGAVGYFGYDLGRRWLPLAAPVVPDGMPAMAVGIYDWALVVDHLGRRACWIGWGAEAARAWAQWGPGWQAPAAVATPQAFGLSSAIAADISATDYRACFDRIQHYVHEGDCYQVNFAQRFRAGFDGSPWAAYQVLRAMNPAPYGAYLNLPFGQVLSSSPEQFLGLQASRVTTRPIKGTRPRLADAAADARSRDALLGSAKDRAENLMIVDLLRNDLGRVCRPGSIAVPQLFAVESFATVHHLVSTVSGELAEGKDALDLLRACFPGGSITGAPKLRAMQIIDELETAARGVYCGAVGWIGVDGAMDSNIAIRTLTIQDGEVRYWAGGGIVADSEAEAEYQESLDKAAAFFRLFDAEPPCQGSPG